MPVTKKFGVGIIGGAGGVGHAHINCCRLTPAADVMGICDIDEVNLKKTQDEYGIKYITTEYKDLLKQKDIDIIIIGTPDYQHAEQAIDALKAGKHVLCEKPMVTTLNDAKRLVNEVRRSNCKFLAGYINRFLPLYKEIKRIYGSGVLGDAFFVEGSYIHDMYEFLHPDGKYYTPWRISREHPRDFFIADGGHPLGVLKMVVNDDIDEVFAYSTHRAEPVIPTDDFTIMTFKFKKGCIGKIVVTVGCRGEGMGEGFCNIFGTKGTVYLGKLYFQNQKPKEIVLEKETLEIEGHPFHYEISHLIDCIINDKTPSCDVIEGAKIVSALVSGVESARKGTPVKVFNEF